MPLLNGVEAARQIARAAPAARVLVLSSHSDAQHVRQAVEAGVAGYLMKESAADDLLDAIRETDSQGLFFSPPLFNHLLKESRSTRPIRPTASARAASLSRRDAEVLQLIAEGYCTKQIAGLLFISKKTAEAHRQKLMNKLNMHRIATLTRYAVSRGVIESNPSPHWPAAAHP